METGAVDRSKLKARVEDIINRRHDVDGVDSRDLLFQAKKESNGELAIFEIEDMNIILRELEEERSDISLKECLQVFVHY